MNAPERLTDTFGVDMDTEEIIDTLGFFDDWEDRYRYIIDLGKSLPDMPEEQKREELLVRGCQSQVWLEWRKHDGRIYFKVDSDALIVRGLIALIMAAFNGHTPRAILDFDIDGYFSRLDLLKHLSPTRGNGLQAMVQRVRHIASEQLAG